MKKRFLVGLLIALLLLTGCGKKLSEQEISELLGTDQLEYEYFQASYVINTEDLSEVAEYSSHIFVGEVVQYERTDYGEDVEDVETYYYVKVLDSIKGPLTAEQEVRVVKEGGIAKSHEKFIVASGDVLPAVGKGYVFACRERSDGTLYCAGPNSSVQLDVQGDYTQDVIYHAFLDAWKK